MWTSSSTNNRHRGTAMVEFAIVLPLLVILVFGITELGRAIYQQQTLTKATATGARFMARAYDVLDVDAGCAPKNPPPPAKGWSDQMARAKILVVTAGKDDPVVPGLTVGDVTITAEPRLSGSVCVITVTVATTFEGIFGDRLIPLTNFGMPVLNTRAEEVYIGE